MKRKNCNSKGVTLLALVITIIVLLILAAVATYSGMDIIQSSKLTAFTTEMKIMQTQVNDLYDQWKNGEINKDEVGKDLTYDTTVQNQANNVLIDELGLENNFSDLTGYRYFDQETIQGLGIDGVEQEFFVNIENREVISYEGLLYDGDMYYTLNQLPQGLYNVDYDPQQGLQPSFDVSFEKIGDEKYRITISNIQYDGYIDKWYVKYQEEVADYWNTTEDMSFVVDKKVNYKVYIENGDVKSEEKLVEIVSEEFSRAHGEIDIEFLSGKTDNVTNNANAPILGTNMVPVNFNSSTNTWDEVSEENWEYSYINTPKESKWANAVMKDSSGNRTGYFVWIPRYAYKITYYDDSYTNILGYSDARGIVRVDGVEYIGGENRRKVENNYIVHPAFTNDVEVGGWDREIEGIWVAKYEASSKEGNSENEQGDNVITKTVQIKPAVKSWKNIDIGTAYTVSKNYSKENSSHLIKNSEWGAVAYLSYSNYGIGKETKIEKGKRVDAGTYYYYTGGDDNETEVYIYHVNKSTIGNVYGIYDMNGGSLEYVSAYLDNSDNQIIEKGKALVDAAVSNKLQERRTVTTYEVDETGESNRTNNYKLSSKKFGDAIYETSTSADNVLGAWQDAIAIYPFSNLQLFGRGGFWGNNHTSIFYFNCENIDTMLNSFRPVLIP